MSHDPSSPTDRLDREPDPVMTFTCQYCDEEIDQIDVSVEAFEVAGGPCCVSCFWVWDEG